MKTISLLKVFFSLFLVLLIAEPRWIIGQGTEESKPFKPEELDQLLAPIALYPDSLLTQILMASTYPLEIVQADRWVKQNKDLKGDALTTALENQNWDPSVKSLVNFPQVLSMMSEKLEWTQKLGDAFLAQQKDVMDTVQTLRRKAYEEGNLKATKEQKVIVQEKVIIIEPASPEVVYVPVYNPTVVYGVWVYPAYPPYYYYPPGYVYATPYAFAAGVAVGVAWGYAWGHSDWGHGDVDINVARNTNINNKIDRDKYKNDLKNKGQIGEGGRGNWKHDASHRKGVSYRDQGTAQKFNRGTSREAASGRESYRGRADQGRQDLGGGVGDRATTRAADRGGVERGGRDSAFEGGQRGSEARQQSDRGRSSRQSMSSGGGSRGGGGRGGGGGGRRR